MSDTIVDMAKVTQMLDADWEVNLFKNEMGSYTAAAKGNDGQMRMARIKLSAFMRAAGIGQTIIDAELNNDAIDTDDFTPEQALTRLAYKVHGEII